jgi:hypothetical protein
MIAAELWPVVLTPRGISEPRHMRHASTYDVGAAESPAGIAGTLWSARPLAELPEGGEWHRAAAGWWFCLGPDAIPERFEREPLVDREEIHVPGLPMLWVPRLLRFSGAAGDLIPAVPLIYRGGNWHRPAHFGPINNRLRAIMTAGPEYAAGHAELLALAIDILGLSYFLGRDEIDAAGWLRACAPHQLAKDVLMAATGGYELQRLLGLPRILTPDSLPDVPSEVQP